MTKDVLINISGLQMELDDGEPVEMMTTGDYYLKNGKHFILYDEIEDDHQVVKNILKIGPKTVEISKKGGRNSHMVFEKGKENLSYYDTPFGSLLLGVSTSDIRWMEKEDHMNLQVDYDLSINSDHISKCRIDEKRFRRTIAKTTGRNHIPGRCRIAVSFRKSLLLWRRSRTRLQKSSVLV